MTTLAFDVYATLINTYGMVDLLQRYIGQEKAMPFATLWRDKQLEYSFRRSMMGRYEPFYTCTSNALDYCIEAFGVTITSDQHFSLVKRYQTLPVFKDVITTLKSLSERSDIRMYALTNGPMEDVERLFEDNNIEDFFRDIVSADEIRKFKPDPGVYQHFLDRTDSKKQDSWLISGNSFDVIGASSFGMNTVWLRRSEQQIYDTWGDRPTHVISSMHELEALY
jgi:2-haloacid dehalogenase